MALTDGLVAYYKLDGNSNDVFGNNGTDTNITYSAANGKLIQGAGFNGASSSIVRNSFNLSSSNVITISAWVKYTSVSTMILLEHSPNYNTNNGFIFYCDAGKINAGMRDGVTVGYNVGANTSTSNDGNWHHVVVIFNRNLTGASQTNMYLDGAVNYVSALSVTTTGNFTTQNLYIGARNASSLWFNSALDEISIWNRALSADEVKDLYLNGNGSQYPFRDKMFF